MRRRIEMRAGMFAAGNVVPVPGRAALVVARNLRRAERIGLRQRRRQLDHRRRRFQRLRHVDNTDLAVSDSGSKFQQQVGHVVIPFIGLRADLVRERSQFVGQIAGGRRCSWRNACGLGTRTRR